VRIIAFKSPGNEANTALAPSPGSQEGKIAREATEAPGELG